MNKVRSFLVDTNLFIAGFGESPNEFEIFHQILRKQKITIVVPDYVKKEMRWYMRRIIEPKIIVKVVNPKKLAQFEVETAKKVDIKLPQTPDMAVAYLAAKENIPLVSSDLRLVEVSQKIGQTAMMNSAFLVMLLGEVTDLKDKKYLEKLYEKLFSDEITYSVQSQSRYDPVVRIQKIMNSTLNVVRNQVELTQQAGKRMDSKSVKHHDIQAYMELQQVTREVRGDISEYITILEEGNYRKLEGELKEASALLMDLATEVRMAGIEEEDKGYKEAMTTVAHLLLLASTVALGEQKLEKAEAYADLLLLFLLENDEVEERLDIDVHLLRIALLFLTGQLNRLKFYFSPTFIQLCQKRERQDILDLHRTMSILLMILSNKEAEKKATVRDISEIEFIIQLGMQFVAVNKVENAWLLFEQAIYMSFNSNFTGLLYAVLEVMLPLSFMSNINFEPSFKDILRLVKKHDKTIPIDDYLRRSRPNHEVDEQLLRPRTISDKRLPNQLVGFLDIISAEIAEFKKIGRCVFVRAIDWQTMHFIGIVDPTLSLDESLTVGSSVKILKGRFRVIKPLKSIRESRKVDLLIIAKPIDLKFIVRRAGQLSITQSKVGEYDL